MSFKDKVVIVTGASAGIGAAIAEAFSAEGARVAIVGRNEEQLNNVASRCTNPLVLRADISIDDDIRRIIDKTIEKFGQIDILINNAGICVTASVLNGDILDAYDKVMQVNLRAVIYLTSLAAPYIIKTKGNIINISSVFGTFAPVMNTSIVYNVSKAALIHFTTCCANELAPRGIRVNTISPGPVVTNFFDTNVVPYTFDKLKASTALNRLSEPKEIADVALFLASDKAKAITASNYVVDNGMAIKRA